MRKSEPFNISGQTDEELLEKYTIRADGRTFVPARVLDAIGRHQVQMANRKPGDLGTIQNPIIKDGKAFAYNSRNRLAMVEDYDGQ